MKRNNGIREISKKDPYNIRQKRRVIILSWTGRALIDVYGAELTLRVDDEAITFKVGQTSKYSYNDVESTNRIDVIDVAWRGLYFGRDRGLSYKQIDSTGDIHLLEELLNNDPSSSPLPSKELNMEEIKTVKSSIDEPLKLELKELPSHLEYAFLEGTDKLPVIISKELKDEEKSALLNKSHKQVIAWKIFDIKGIDPRFCTYKILMKDDFKPTVQHQRRVNPKIHEVIKKEVIKLLDAGLIYPISHSPWVSPVHCVPKKGGMTVVENEDNELIPTRCMMAIFLDMIEEMMEVFMDDFSVFGDSFSSYLSHFDQMLKSRFSLGETKDRTFSAYTLCEQDYDRSSSSLHYDGKRVASRSILLLHKFDVIIRDKKGAKNLVADHLSRLKIPHQDELKKKEITKIFPLETLGMIVFHGDSSTTWFVDIANYHAGKFIVKRISSQ
nr:DNA-directed DNA polymerase [Tanacetum cinerariifolium]